MAVALLYPEAQRLVRDFQHIRVWTAVNDHGVEVRIWAVEEDGPEPVR